MNATRYAPCVESALSSIWHETTSAIQVFALGRQSIGESLVLLSILRL